MKSKKILIADDDPAICDALQFMLEEEGYTVATSADGDTVSKIKQIIPDLLLLDIWMSGEDGRDICRILKNQLETKNIPIIMISASRDIGKSARDAGADDFLAKPFQIDELLGKIQKYIQG